MSNTYKDAKWREWVVSIDVGTLKRIRLLTGCKLDDVFPKEIADKGAARDAAESYGNFLNDDEKFSEVLYAILKLDADKANVSHEEFDAGLAGDANQRAMLAFHGAFADFSQNPRRTILRGMNLELKKMTKKLATLDAMTDEQLQTAIDKASEAETSKASVGNTPEPSVLTLAS